MSIVTQLREEAEKIANSMTLEIFEAASEKLSHNRFDRLRKKITLPKNAREAAYVHALGQYVHNKIRLHHLYKNKYLKLDYTYNSGTWADKQYWEAELVKWRDEMDRIEFVDRPEMYQKHYNES